MHAVFPIALGLCCGNVVWQLAFADESSMAVAAERTFFQWVALAIYVLVSEGMS